MLRFNEADILNYKLLKQFAHENRTNMTEAEAVLWQYLRCNEMGHKFLRQYIIGNYIVDFICRDTKLVIEVDGAYHAEPRQLEDDKERDEFLRSRGYHVIRFTNDEVFMNTDHVIKTIKEKNTEILNNGK